MLTMLLGGLWHGANWTFLIWGALHGAALVVDHAYRRSAFYARVGQQPWAVVIDWAVTFHFVCFCWLFFRAPSLDGATAISRRDRHRQRRGLDHAGRGLAAAGGGRVHAVHSAGLALPARRMARPSGQAAQVAFGAAALYAIVVMAPSAAAPFIYFQF